MATKVRPELSKKNELWISKHRFYELKHYCLQYPEWKKQLNSIYGINANKQSTKVKTSNISDKTASTALLASELKTKIDEIDRIAKKTDVMLSDYIIKAVTEDRSYVYLKNYLNIPCSRDVYYKLYRTFFALLDKSHG